MRKPLPMTAPARAFCQSLTNLSDRLQEVKMENKALRGTVADFERVKRAFGPEEVERAVEDAKRQEVAEKEQRKAKRKFSRGAR